jgi:hypothetical protein
MAALAAACGGPAATDPLDGAWEATTRSDESGVDRSVFVLEHGFLGSRRGGVVSFHNDVRLKDLAITEVRFNSPEVHLAMKATGVRFKGRLDQPAGTIVGELTYRDGSSRSLTLTRIPDRELTRPFVPAGFEVPNVLETPSFRLRKLTEADAEKDYEAVMSSVDHIRATLPPGNWPWPGYTLRQNRRALTRHEREFDRREAFAYTVVTPDEREVLGCVYINPYPYGRADAAVFLWVTTESVAAGVEPVVFSTVRAWLTDAWPFRSVVFPGRMPPRREEAPIGTETTRWVPRSPLHHCHLREIPASRRLICSLNTGSSRSSLRPRLSHRVTEFFPLQRRSAMSQALNPYRETASSENSIGAWHLYAPVPGTFMLPSPFGICTRRTGGAKYVPDLKRSRRDLRFESRSSAYSAAATSSAPAAPSLRVCRYASYIHATSM